MKASQPDFATEKLARDFLEQLLTGWFYLKPEVWLIYPQTGNRLRIDYLAKPKPGIGFPFPLFGIECKKENEFGRFNQAIKQGIDYTQCLIVDDRASLANVRNQRLGRVYLFPAPKPRLGLGEECARGWNAGVERVASLFRVGVIYVRHTGNPQFCMSGDRQWDADQGPIAAPTHVRDLVGNGTIRRAAVPAKAGCAQ